jgi:putative DNA primase/helicase
MSYLNIELIAKQLGKARRIKEGWSCCCPAHSDTNPSLSLSWGKHHQKLLAYCFAGCSFDSILKALKKEGILLKESYVKKSDYKPPVHQFSGFKKNQKDALKIWKECRLPQGSVVETYLQSRGYRGSIPSSIKFHPQIWHSNAKRSYPGMVASISFWPNEDIYSIHRTYLNQWGIDKADIEPNKMMLGEIKGGAVRLTPPGSKLIIAEGLETGLSVYLSMQWPTWVALSASGIRNIVVPSLEITQEIIIAADGDKTGLEAANTLAKRLSHQGYIVKIASAPEGLDFNDVLRRPE